MPTALVIRAPGTNCDQEMCRAFQLAGATPELMHLDALVRDPSRLAGYQLIGFPGGFSYGDDIASGRIFAMRCREKLYPALREAVERGVPMIGACNGFQVLVQIGMLPGPSAGLAWPAQEAPAQSVALTDNENGRFCDRWVGMIAEPESKCIWTKGIEEEIDPRDADDVWMFPVAHGEGRFICKDEAVLHDIESSGRVALRYSDNYNGSQNAIAGICDASGLVFGLMPHPERFLEWTRHPYWTRLDPRVRSKQTPGLRIFQNAVRFSTSSCAQAS
ncbi:MAG: phosphoribosylformylglycinamidine synthase subunit PurQ [Phycisphaeraceae bacterium]|nr:phosphoribosylformylglycinamidine synthase subunit PurQ [Phycisphaeraceae bacterium]